MDSSKHLTNVVLFPLCDVHSVLIDTLCDTSDKPGTRADSLLLAWRFSLPDGMDISKAAEAVLVVANSVPRKSWSSRQSAILHELNDLAGRQWPKSSSARFKKSAKLAPHPMRRSRDTAPRRNVIDELASAQKSTSIATPKSSPALAPKETKKWWKLVGRESLDTNAGQRKTRKERVSREP